MSLGQVGSDFRVPLRGKILQSGSTLGGTYKYANLFDGSGNLIAPVLGSAANAAIAAPVGFSTIQVGKAIYDFTVDGGAQGLITPVSTCNLPANAIILGGTIDAVVAVTSLGSATVSVGTSAGSSASALLAATAKASLSLAALLNAVPVFATPVKLTAAGNITVTVGAADVTAGKLEIYMYFVVSAQA